jgi:hypothetical protein
MCSLSNNINFKFSTNHSHDDAVFWDVVLCSSSKNKRFGELYRLHHQDEKISGLGTTLTVISNVFPSSLVVFILMMQAISSSETFVLTRATWRQIPEDGILPSHCCENLKPYNYSLVPDF